MEASSNLRVLYIDDDPGISRLVQRHLERAGYFVRCALDGDAGLQLARTGEFDAIALDHYMPGRDGLEVLVDLRNLVVAAPVVFVTAAEEPRIAVTALKEGAVDYVVKDVHGAFLDLLTTALRQAVAEIRLRRAKERAEQELRESRDRLQRLAEQQGLLLREVNHRVANSLQLIRSLVEMQARRVQDPEARDVLIQASKRVEAVAMVHRRLYTGDDVQHVHMDQYLEGLVDELRRSVSDEHNPGSIHLEVQPMLVETDKAISIGLIVNELVTNALKYAYLPGRSGDIRVQLRHQTAQADSAACVRLIVEDDGIGYPLEAQAPRGSGMGALIVAAMARTIGGEVALDRRHRGTRFVLDMLPT